MEIDVRIGERLYTFDSHESINEAREIYATFVGSQNDFETEMENKGIEFTYSSWG